VLALAKIKMKTTEQLAKIELDEEGGRSSIS
jgi:hypothetical protein